MDDKLIQLKKSFTCECSTSLARTAFFRREHFTTVLRLLGKGLFLIVGILFTTTGCQSGGWRSWDWVPPWPDRTVDTSVPALVVPLSSDMLVATPRQLDASEAISPEEFEASEEFLPSLDRPENTTVASKNESENPVAKLDINDVTDSVLAIFPDLQIAMLEQNVASGNLTAAMGAFDLNLRGQTINQPIGYYENYRQSLGFSQNVATNGSMFYGGYRIGAGDFQPWYKERETNRGGEVAFGAVTPLRQNRLIDARRAAVYRAEQDLQATDPLIRNQEISLIRDASAVYWIWVGVGNALDTHQRLLGLAIDRARAIDQRVQRGDLPRLANIDNDRLIAQRQAKLVEAQRKFEEVSLKLSFFLRDSTGQMLVPGIEFVPGFPDLLVIDKEQLQDDLSLAIDIHPEIRQLDFEINKAEIDIAAARNMVLARVDAFAETSQDMGSSVSPSGDKSPLEVEVGIMAELPLQRRFGLGRLSASEAKLRQVQLKRELLTNKIQVALQDSYSAMLNARERLARSRENLELALQALDIAKNAFSSGDIDLIVLNIYEEAEANAELLVIDAEIEFFIALAQYRFAMGTR